jgi:2,3-bisphosphoglycerate-independent phosphoglycerate mutase
MLLLPDHPTPVRLKTHTTDSVPYLLVDSQVDGPGGFYSESGTAEMAPIAGHSLMGRLIVPTS